MAVTLEYEPQLEAVFAELERQSAENRAERLASLPKEGFTAEQHQHAVDMIVAVGLPIDNYRKLMRRPNKRGTEDVLGSWGAGSENYGEFSFYDLIDKQIPEKQIEVATHEGVHANTARNPDNAHLYGGEDKRKKAELFAENLAGQTLITKTYLSGYHKWLADKLEKNEIDTGTFVEETQAIAAGMALTNRAKLEQVEAAQHNKIEKMKQAGQVTEDFEPVNLLSSPDANGDTQLDGIDVQMATLIDGVTDYESLIEHTQKLKEQFYSGENLAAANERTSNRVSNDQAQKISKIALRHIIE